MSDSYSGSDIYNPGGSGSSPIMTSGYAIETFPISIADNPGYQLYNQANQGSIVGSLKLSPLPFTCKSLSCYPTQLSTASDFCLGIADPEKPDVAGTGYQIIAKTDLFGWSALGEIFKNIAWVWDDTTSAFIAGTEVNISGAKNYWWCLYGPSSMSGAAFVAANKGSSGVSPFIGICKDNLSNTMPNSIPAGYFETSYRYHVAASTEVA